MFLIFLQRRFWVSREAIPCRVDVIEWSPVRHGAVRVSAHSGKHPRCNCAIYMSENCLTSRMHHCSVIRTSGRYNIEGQGNLASKVIKAVPLCVRSPVFRSFTA